MILAIDPGPIESAYLVFDGQRIIKSEKIKNELLRDILITTTSIPVVIEMMTSYGMPVGAEVMETLVWIGRFIEVSGQDNRVTRKKVAGHICKDATAKDVNVRLAVMDRVGHPGTKKSPGPTYGLTKDMWAALAVALWAWDNGYGKDAAPLGLEVLA